MELELLNQIIDKARSKKKTIVLPESHDERVLKAAEILTKKNIASVITIGNEEKVRSDAAKLKIDLSGVRIIDPEKSDKHSDFSNIYFNLRKKKGITIEEAREAMKRDLFFGAMMVKEGMVDGSVAGSTASTADVLACRDSMRWNVGRNFNCIKLFLNGISGKNLQFCRLCSCAGSGRSTISRHCNFNFR